MFVEGRYLHNLKVSINILITNYEEKTGIFTGEKLGEPLNQRFIINVTNNGTN